MSKVEDDWDWRWLFFAGTHLFGFSVQEFWQLTPRQLTAFSEEYVNFKETANGSKEKSKKGAKSKPKQEAMYWDEYFG